VDVMRESSTEEVARLRGCLDDLASIMELPALWAGDEPAQIVSTFLDALLGTLRPGFICVRLNDPVGGPAVEMMRIAESLQVRGTAGAQEISQAIDLILGDAPPKWPQTNVSIREVDLSVACAPLGLRGEIGIVVAGSPRPDFPTQSERLVLDVAANQAAVGLQEARLLVESERNSRLLVDSIPGLVAFLTTDGQVEFVNRQIIQYTGISLEELKHWGTDDTVHPEDLPQVIQTFTQSIVSGSPYEIMQRLRRSDGVYLWFQNNGFPLRDASGTIVRWCVLLTDIDERKRAEEALRDSERNLQLIVDTVPALAWSARPDGTADYFNQHYLDFIGLSAEQASGWGWTAAVHPEDVNGLAATWQHIMASETLREAEARLRRYDGEYRWFLFRANPLRDESGTIVKWHGINIDIEDRKRAEEALRSSELNLRQMTETIPEMLWSATPEGAIDYCNSRFLEYTGFSAEEVVGDGWQRTIHPDDAARVGPVWMACVASGAPYRVEVRTFHAADGAYRLCAVTALPLLDDQGHILKWHGTIIDMQDWKQAQEELRNTQAALAHLARVMTMGELTASIAHEVNQPLSGIVTNASTCLRMLAADPPNIDGARETARRTIRDGNRASEIIERLRALFSKREVSTEAVDLNDAVREVIALSSSELNKNQVMLRSELADHLPPVTGDRVQLQQVVLNLIMNASDAMSGVDDRPRQLFVRTEPESSGHVRLIVQDTGVGFEPQDMDRLFEAFYTTKSTGMGMGLSVSRSIIARHHGRLWAAMNDGPGATFAFSIPCSPADETSAGTASA
jgi:PAS domain S-box-containing protein